MADQARDASNEMGMLWGADAIANAIGVSRRVAYYRLESGHLPAKKVGRVWCISREALRRALIDDSEGDAA